MLDWGLGHTTRCIPMIKELINQGFHVIVAGTKSQVKILSAEFPELEYKILAGYNISFTRKKWLLPISLVFRIPGILVTIKKEKAWINEFAKERPIQIIISDNRPGFRNKNIHSIYLTHQLTVKTGNFITEKIATWLHNTFITKFDECWVPDNKNLRLAGALSKTNSKNIFPKYIGPLSRFYQCKTEKQFDIAIILSGPEPQRSIFEKIILNQIKDPIDRIILVRGLPNEVAEMKGQKNLLIKNHLSASDLNRVICSSGIIISRSGYTSIMDYIKLGAKAILVPTPGQGEQEYLAKYLADKKYFATATQHNFPLLKIVEGTANCRFEKLNVDFDHFRIFINSLRKRTK